MLRPLSKPSELVCLLFIVAVSIFLLSCTNKPPERMIEAPPPPEPEPSLNTSTPSNLANLPPPKPDEVNSAIERVFKGAVTIETKRNPYFLVGDFNGDLSQDIAVVIKPVSARLEELNDEMLARWILVDPILLTKPVTKVMAHPEMEVEKVKRQRVRVYEKDVLLAVIHGYGSNGWRDADATQTYLLNNSAGDKIRAQSPKYIIKSIGEDKLPRLWGDVIEQTISGQSGFLYYNGAKYLWYNPESYKPGPPRIMVHKGFGKAKQQ
ncbi:MAG: hypothetical protein AB1489_15190 [Acidobacteriota bacterium]